MPTEVTDQISELFSAMAIEILQTLFIYFGLPFLVILIISRFVFRIRGKLLSAMISLAAFGSLYFYLTYGIPQMQLQ